jgi:NADH dehydrogenase
VNVFVTGGTGFVGREVVARLLAAGHCPTLLQRRHPAPTPEGAQGVLADLFDTDSIAKHLLSADAVVHCVGIISEVRDQTFERVHIEATRHLVAAATRAGVRRFVHISALGTRPNAVSRYHRSKWEAEGLIRASGLDWTILRPSLIYGRHDQFTNLFARLSRWSPVIPVMGSGRGLLQPVAVEVVATAAVRALTTPGAVGGTFDLCGRERMTFLAVLDAILEVTGRRRWKWPIPMPVARLQAAVLEWLFPVFLGQAPPLNRDQLVMLQEDNVGDPEPAAKLFGLRFESFRDGLRALGS